MRTLAYFLSIASTVLVLATWAQAAEFFKAEATDTQQVVHPLSLPEKNATVALCEVSFRHVKPLLAYRLDCFNAEAITQAHIHLGHPAENGPPVVFLFEAMKNPTDKIDGMVSQGTLTDASVIWSNMTLDDVMEAMRAGKAYINVHTEKNPVGEVRGQVSVAKEIVDF